MKFSRLCIVLALFSCLLFETVSAQYTRQWAARYTGIGKKGNDAATAITSDDSGYVYVAGSSQQKSTGYDFVVLKYHPDGALIWAAYYNGSGKGTDKAVAIDVDTAYSVYVTGSSQNASKGIDYATVKFNKNGSQVWAVRYNGDGNGDDVPVAIAVNDSLNVYVTGYSKGTSSGYDIATVKYDRNGVQQWVQRFNGPANGDDKPYAMYVRGIFDVYVVGSCADTAQDYITLKYGAASGALHWSARYNGPGNGDDIARALVLHTTTDIFVTGSSLGTGTGLDYCTIDYDTSGAVQWVSRYNGSASGDDIATTIGIYSTSRVYVSGKSLQVGSYNDMTTVMYDFSGSQNWVDTHNGPANDNDYTTAMAPGNTLHIAGASTGVGVGLDFSLVEIKGNNGGESWEARYNGIGNANDIPTAMATANNAFYITGTTSPDGKSTNIVTIKYVDPSKIKYRTFVQDSLTGKGVAFKSLLTKPNYGNVRDTAFSRGFPKIKSGNPGAPGLMVLGNARPDSAKTYGWIRFSKGGALASFFPQTGPASGFVLFHGSPFVGEKKDPKLAKYNNTLAGELAMLKLNIGASDAEVTPPGFGDLAYSGVLDTIGAGILLQGFSLRDIVSLTDNFLTYSQEYPVLDWNKLTLILRSINQSFLGPLTMVNQAPLVIGGVNPIDSATVLSPGGKTAVYDPMKFQPGTLDATPKSFALNQNYPNPFNPTTTMSFTLGEPSSVTLMVYNMLGQEVATLLPNIGMGSGEHSITFNGDNLASGVYFYKLTALRAGTNNVLYQEIKKMILMK